MKRRTFLGRLAAAVAGLTAGVIAPSSSDKANGEVGRLAPPKVKIDGLRADMEWLADAESPWKKIPPEVAEKDAFICYMTFGRL